MPIKLGVPLDIALSGVTENGKLDKIILQSSSKPFLIIPGASTIFVILHKNIEPSDILEAFCRSVFLATVICNRKTSQQSSVQKALSSMLSGKDATVRS